MRFRNCLLIVIPILMLALPALAECPLFGVYTSMGGDLLAGRASESEPTGQSGVLDNAVKAQSWNGAALGTQWSLACPAICQDPQLIEDTIDGSGNGYRVYQTVYCGGTLWLLGTGMPWGAGATEYLADVFNAVFLTTITFELGVQVAHNTVITMDTDVLDCTGVCITLQIDSAVQLGEGLGTEFPPLYPLPVLPPDCTVDDTIQGTWWDINDVTMTIEGCTVPSAERNWGEVKSLYR
jgi:hypothetical protein